MGGFSSLDYLVIAVSFRQKATITELGGRVYITEFSRKSHLSTVQNMEGVPGKCRQERGWLRYLTSMSNLDFITSFFIIQLLTLERKKGPFRQN